MRTYKDGDQWCAVGSNFVNLQESTAGFGNTRDDAVEHLMNELESQLAQALVRERSLFESASYWKAEFVRLRGIVDRLPKTADGVPVVQGDTLFGVSEIDGRIVRLTADEPTLWTAIEDLPDEGVSDERVWDFCANAYSTREAAEAASTAGGPPLASAERERA